MASFTLLSVIVFAQFMAMVYCDVYCQNMRGCNNRLNEKTANRNNPKRLFDSQNNAKGGYNVGDKTKRASNDENSQYQMRYFQSGPDATSFMDIEWTNQHGCGKNTPDDPTKLNCQVVIQYMCSPVEEMAASSDRNVLRDGKSTSTNEYESPQRDSESSTDGEVREDQQRAAGRARQNQLDRGMHERYEWRDKCESRPRNQRLFTADQEVKNDKGASATRQNPNGDRYGYECAEERDYAPYWHPTEWKDIAFLVEDKDGRCEDLKDKSFNVQPYGECVERFRNGPEAHYSFANNDTDCAARNGVWRNYHNFLEKLTDTQGNNPGSAQGCNILGRQKGVDVTYGFAIYGTEEECLVDLPKPDCELAPYARVNHLGNSAPDPLKASRYQWKLPYFPSETIQKCVLRIRYNISTEDYDPEGTDFSKNEQLIEENPNVPVDLPNDQTLRLAINTAQFGRTFQDRSHCFYLRPREPGMEGADIYQLNVRGKRGNIVQTFPAVEYDFMPNDLTVGTQDMVHIQWTGSNTHDNEGNGNDGQAGDDGEGEDGTDRNNILDMADASKNFFLPLENTNNLAHNCKVIWANQTKGSAGPGLDAIDVGLQLATSGYITCLKDCGGESLREKEPMDNLLNEASPSFEGIVCQFERPSVHYIGCTRNNNFSNRSEKGKITVVNGKVAAAK